MGWFRRGQKSYYYRRRDGRSEYLGRGETARLAAQRDEASRSLRTQELAQRQILRRQFLQADGAVRHFTDWAATVCRGVLVLHGYYQHDRGDWRRRGPPGTRTN